MQRSLPPPPIAAAAGWFAAALAFTAFWLSLNTIYPALSPTGIPTAVFRTLIHTVVLTGLWFGLARAEFSFAERLAVWFAIAVPFTAWVIAVWTLAVQGAFVQPPGALPPRLPFAILLPVILLILPLLRSRRLGLVLDAMPPGWLIGLQVYRAFGGIFLVHWMHGNLASIFALPAGIGDVIVGLLALPVALYLASGARGGWTAAILWNILGIADLVNAISIGILTTPGPLQLIVPEAPNTLIVTYPTVMIPIVAVPSSILLHALSLRQLLRQRETSQAAAPQPLPQVA
jgi:hypothetical protein